MKKYIIILLFAMVSFASVNAQSSFSGTTTNPTAAILNATSDTLTYTAASSHFTVAIQPTVTRASGTMAGKVYLWLSANGGSSYVLNDSVTLANSASQTFMFNKQVGCNKFMLIQNGGTTVTGTMSAKIQSTPQ